MISNIENIIDTIYDNTKENTKGEVASYIPQLANVNPDLYGIACCSIDGSIKEVGDSSVYFSIQSCSKPINYCLARKSNPKLNIHEYVGYEPSGRAFNEFIFNSKKLPHNPMINAGAIMVNSLIGPEKEPSERFDIVKEFYTSLGGVVGTIGFDNSIYLSEQNHADRNISLAYEMRSNKVYHKDPSHSMINETLNLYFQSCSISINCRIGSLIAATLANGGINPITKMSILERHIVKDCLSLMYSCGMYDYSGEFSFEIGLPAKSGVSGCLLLVVPNSYGICIWSPRLDRLGNSVRGVEFCKQFVKLTNNQHHIFNILSNKVTEEYTEHMDPLLLTQKIITAASKGDLNELKDLENKIEDIDFNISDYDGRTALHLACNEGQYDIIKYLLEEKKCIVNPKDRWGNTPLHDIKKRLTDMDREGDKDKISIYTNIIELLKQNSISSDTESES
jgi:glutaminase